jgi:hypothetical protein
VAARELVTQQNQVLQLERSYGVCPTCGAGLFPLAKRDELELLPGARAPSLQEDLVHLGTWLPFGKAAEQLRRFRQTDVSRPTVERVTEAAGAAYVAWQTAEVARLERELPEPPAGPAQLFMSVDGAHIPLVGGEWAEVKTLVIGVVQPPQVVKGDTVIRTAEHSYFSRLTDADTFQRLALVETHRRGVETAGQEGFVTDGSEWLQKFADQHRADAVRILDLPHAGEHLAPVGQARFGAGSAEAQSWLQAQMHTLKHEGPAAGVAEVAQLVAAQPETTELAGHLAYLEKRTAQMQYPTFLAAGWPIGDGAVESGNKLVVEARLKGSGMHWARPHVDPLLALRNIVCSDRWDAAWPQIVRTLRQQAQQRQAERRHQRRTARANAPTPLTAGAPSAETRTALAPAAKIRETPVQPASAPPAQTHPNQPWRPPADHPWRRMPVGRARFRPPTKHTDAKP